MPFSVDDFQDLLKLLEQHPEWQAQLRRQVLTGELLEVPARLGRIEQAVEALAQAQVRTEANLAGLAQRMDHLAQRIDALVVQMGRFDGRLGDVIGEVLEARFARRYGSYFSPLARRLKLVDSSALADLLDDAVQDRSLTDAERDEVLRADLVLTGRQRGADAPSYFVVEVSAGIGLTDVQRATNRAAILAKLGQPAVPVVAGGWINAEAFEMVEAYKVQSVLDPTIVRT